MKKLVGVLFGVILAVSGLLLTGCGDPYKDMKLVSETPVVELSVGEEKQVVVSVEGVGDDVSKILDFSPDGEFVTVLQPTEQIGNKTRATIKGLKVGNGTIVVTSSEAQKTLTLQVVVNDNIQSFVRNSKNAFIVREAGQTLNLNPKTHFDFIPTNTLQTDLDYYYNGNLVQSVICEEENDILKINVKTQEESIAVTSSTFELVAKSKYSELDPQILSVNIIDPIKIQSLQLSKDNKIVAESGVPAESGELPAIELISSIKDKSNVDVKINLESDNSLIKANVSTQSVIATKLVSTDREYNLQATNVGKDELKVKLFYEDYEGYYEEKTYDINVVSIPTQIRVFGYESGDVIKLFDKNYNESIASVNLSPVVYATDSSFEKVEVEFCDIDGNEVNNWFDYITLKYKNRDISDDYKQNSKTGAFEILKSDFSKNKLISPLVLLGRAKCEKELFIRFSVKSEYIENEISTQLQIDIKTGAEEFSVVYPDASNEVLYLDKNAGAQIFTGFEITEEAYVGKVTFRNNNNQFFQVEQTEVEEKDLAIKITPLAVGEEEFSIYLPNGKYVKIKIKVEESVKNYDFAIEMNDNIAKYEKTQDGYNLTLMDKKDAFTTNFKFVVSSSATLYHVNLETQSTSNLSVSLRGNTLSLIPDVQDNQYDLQKITFKADLYKIENFEIVMDQTLTYEIDVVVYIPIKSVYFLKMDGEHNLKTNQIDIYSSNTNSTYGVGSFYGYEKGMSKITLYPEVTLYSNETISQKELITYLSNFGEIDEISSFTSNFETKLKYGTQTNIASFGNYIIDNETWEITIDCNTNENNPLESFWLAFNISQYGVKYTASVTFNLVRFTRLTSIGLNNYKSTIYLDDKNPIYKTKYFFNPTNTDCREFDVKFVPEGDTNINVISIQVTEEEIIVNYNRSYGAGSGILHLIPKDRDNGSGQIPNSSQKIRIEISDGTKNNPISINSPEEFIQIASNSESLTKHYVISTPLDFKGLSISTFGILKGSIIGKGEAGLYNLNITNKKVIGEDSYVGLFAYIDAGAEVSGLKISGKISADLLEAEYVGILCGQNKGTIKDVSLSVLSETALTVKSGKSVYVGSLAGISIGDIINAKVNVKNSFEVDSHCKFDDNGVAYDVTNVIFGGFVGKNTGNITYSGNIGIAETNFSFTGDLKTNHVSISGGIAGENTGLINGLYVSGKIHARGVKETNVPYGKNVGGVVGRNYGTVTDCLTRMFITGANYVGGVVGFNESVVENNIVQLCYDGELRPLIISESGEDAGAIVGYGSHINNKALYYQQFTSDDSQENLTNNAIKYWHSSQKSYYKLGEFKYVDTQNTIVVDENNQPFLKEDGTPAENVAYMQYYQAKDSVNQYLISELNTQNLPIAFENPENLTFISRNTKILTFEADGKVKLWGTGFVRITVKSLLNTTISKDIYVHVLNAFDDFEIRIYEETYLSKEGSLININLNGIQTLNFEFTHKSITSVNGELLVDKFGQPLSIELVNNQDFKIISQIQVDGEDISDIISIISGNRLILNAVNDNQSKIDLTVTPTFGFELDGVTYFYGFNADQKFEAMLKIIRGTTKIQLSTQEIYLQPNDEFEIAIENWITDNENDKITVTYSKVGESTTNNDMFEILSLTENADKTQNYIFKFNLEKYSENYEGTYYINFTAQNGKRETLIVNLTTQTITAINVKNFYDIDKNDFNETAEPVKDVSPDGDNLMEIILYPEIADYDYITVENDEANYTNNNNAIFALVEKRIVGEEEKSVQIVDIFGATNEKNGIKIPKAYINDGKLLLKYNITSSAQDASKAKFIISVCKNDEIQKFTTISVDVRIREGVNVKIVGKEDAVTTENIFVARGLTYDLDVSIHGFTEEEVYFDSTSSAYASIQKVDGEFKLIIGENIVYEKNKEGYEVKIECYGQKVVDGRVYTSAKKTLKLLIVDYVILRDDIVPYNFSEKNTDANIVINGAEKEVLNIALGNTIELNLNFINGETIEFNARNNEIAQRIKALGSTFAKNGSWFVTNLVNANEKIKLDKNNLISNQYYRIEYNNITQLFSIVPLYVVEAQAPTYYLSFEASYKYVSGQIVLLNNEQNLDNFNTDFLVEAYQSGNEDNEIPISNYEEFVNMKAGAYYSLVNDIELKDGFTPITTKIAGLNGNGHTITYRPSWTLQNLQYVGLFETIQEGTLVRNLKIKFSNELNTNITITNEQSSTYFGVLAGENNGVITNCEVLGNESNVYVSINPNRDETSYVAGLVGHNKGYITNSRVSINLVVRKSNLAGLVGVNERTISSSYVNNSSLTNESTISSKYKTAGFVMENGLQVSSELDLGGVEVAKILTSFTSGVCTSNIYSDETKRIWSNVEVSGFVMNNLGYISDCYANMPINSQSIRTGFAMNNSGHITNSYSTSTFIGENRQTDFGFIKNNFYSTQEGTLENCKYLYGNKNSGIFITNLDGLEKLTELDFGNKNKFQTYSISDNNEKTKGVWFFPNKNEDIDFKLNGKAQTFVYGRPELVAPNIIVDTSRVLESSREELNGEKLYTYSGGEEQGSKFNPYIITSAKKLESLILETNVNSRNSKYYRIVNNINYLDESIYNSELYTTTFIGDIEGNGMTISGLIIDTRKTLNYGGLFAKIGEGATYVGCIKNLNLKPKYINMPNTSCVGTLAGSLESGLLYNIKIDGTEYTSDGLVIIGKNIVGGVVGITSHTFKINNVECSISASATYRSINNGAKLSLYTNLANMNKISYAGVIAGVLNGDGKANYVKVSENTRVLAEVAGLYFGCIGKGTYVSDINADISSNQFVNASYYGGIFAGEIRGDVQDVIIKGTISNFFRYVPFVPTAVGSVAGYMNSGSLSDIQVDVSLICPEIETVGGVVGKMLGGTISNTTFTGDITAKGIVGGVVGFASDTSLEETKIDPSAILIDKCKVVGGKLKVVNDNHLSAYVGGIIGLNQCEVLTVEGEQTQKYAREILNSYTEVEISIDCAMYNGLLKAGVGGFVGASYTSASRTEAGLITIETNDFAKNFLTIIEGYYNVSGKSTYYSSNCTFIIKVKNYREGGEINISCSGIIGKGQNASASELYFGEIAEETKDGEEVYYATIDFTTSIEKNGAMGNINIEKGVKLNNLSKI